MEAAGSQAHGIAGHFSFSDNGCGTVFGQQSATHVIWDFKEGQLSGKGAQRARSFCHRIHTG
jgi:hypothetical protein